MIEQKRCPFCGSGTKVFKRLDRDTESFCLYWIDCSNLKCQIQFPLGERTEEAAIKKWNTRKVPIIPLAEIQRTLGVNLHSALAIQNMIKEKYQ